MVTKQKVEELIYAEMAVAVQDNDNVSSEDIFIRGDDSDIERPRIVYSTTKTKQDYNAATRGVYGYIYNNSGEVISEVHREYINLRFNIEVLSTDQSIVNTVYEDLRQYFLKYEERILDYESLHSELNNITVDTDNRPPEYGVDPTQMFEVLPVDVEFYRKVTEDSEPIRSIDHDVEEIQYVTTDTNVTN